MVNSVNRFISRECDHAACGSEPARGGCRKCGGTGYVSVNSRSLNPHERDELIAFLIYEAGDVIHEERYPFEAIYAERYAGVK